jgi:phenylalanyl-tRNA synthetase beta chain
MRIPLSWLSDFIDIEASNTQIAHVLTELGLEVDAIENITPQFNGVVIGEVMDAKPHPDADKLVVAQVSDGTETVQVVCGASNCRPGIKVAFAKIGAALQNPDGTSFKIKKSKLRGVESSGMLCAADELGLAAVNEGIMELGDAFTVGADLAAQYGDTVFEISLTPNLGHCFSVLGVARELAAAFERPVTMPKVSLGTPEKSSKSVKINVKDFERCPRYSARLITGVKIAPSPEWLQKKLLAAGMRPINNVVDITNYVLFELGQPLHAFDYNKIQGQEVIVRTANEKELFKTLDGKERILTSEDLVIADQKKILAIGGVMGGLDSEVNDQTTDVLLESAYFAPFTIRRTSRRLGLQTEASKRFERGTDPNMVVFALDRAAELICSIAGGKIASEAIDMKNDAFAPLVVDCRLPRVNQMLGIPLSLSEVESALQRLHMQTQVVGHDVLKVTVPTYRSDVTQEIDLIEEVARMYGYNNIRREIETYRASEQPHSPIFLFEREMRANLCGEGLQELLTCDLISPKLQQFVQNANEEPVTVLNPVSEDQSVLRTSLMPGLLELVRYNQDHQIHDVAGFEIGKVYFKDNNGYREQVAAGIVMTGKQRPDSWDQKPLDVDFYDLKGVIENILAQLGIENTSFKKSRFNALHPGRQASVFIGEMEVATIGEVHPAILREMGINQPVLFAEISLKDLLQRRKKDIKMQPLAKYPGSERDWTITLEETTPIQTIFDAVQTVPSRLLEKVTLKDIFRHETKVGKGLKNATFHFVYRDQKKTLSQEAVETEHARIIDETNKTLTR